MIKLILVRHGETDWNAQRRYQGQSDVPLNDAGQRQAAALAQRLEGVDISAIYSSDLRRARQTATAIASLHPLPVRDEPRLKEISFGRWEGLTYGEIQERWPEEMAAWFADPIRVTPPGGERLAQVAERLRPPWTILSARTPVARLRSSPTGGRCAYCCARRSRSILARSGALG